MARRKRTDAWSEQLVEAPKAGLPEHRQQRRSRSLRTYLWVSSLAFTPTLLMVLVLLGNSMSAEAEPTDVSAGEMTLVETQARAAAMETVTTWLKSDPSPLPTGRLLTWDGEEEVPVVTPTDAPAAAGTEDIPEMRVHRMTLVTDSGALFTAEVNVEITAAGAIPITGPSLIPYTPSPDSYSQSLAWPGSTSMQVPDTVREAANAWARAFTSGDPAQLKLLVGDESADNAYVPLPAITLVELNTRSATPAPGAVTTDADGRDVDPDKLLVQLDLRLSWPGQDTGQGTPRYQAATYDLLVHGANTGSPRVVAWGGPGTGPTLEAYSNAVAGVEITTSEAPAAEATTSTESTGTETTAAATAEGEEAS